MVCNFVKSSFCLKKYLMFSEKINKKKKFKFLSFIECICYNMSARITLIIMYCLNIESYQLNFLGENLFTVMEDDLRICSVKPACDAERRFCFEVLSPTK